jgi:tetratricopeptide (TPR) repeat protein
MSRFIVTLALVFVVSTGLAVAGFAQEDFERTLSRAQALYYEARFKDSIDLLLPIDATLREQSNRAGLSVNVKLQLALGYIGQNEVNEAKSVFQQLCILDPEYSLDSNQFAPKVLALFEEARAATAVNSADMLYKQGVEAYKHEDLEQAAKKFRAALRFRPDHELAMQYAELAEGKMKLTMERRLLDSRKLEAEESAKTKPLEEQLGSSSDFDATPEPAPPEPRIVPAVEPGCLQMTSQLALVRLKTRVNPDILPQMAPLNPVNIRAKVRIDESGNVAVTDIAGPNLYLNQAMRTAIEKWKFLPAILESERRCVETEIPIVLGRS